MVQLRIASILLLTMNIMVGSFASFAASPCHLIRICDDFKYLKSKGGDSIIREKFNFKNETEIVLEGHSNGIIPSKYKLSLKMTKDSVLEGSAEIVTDIVKRTSRISINADKDMDIDYRSMVIKSIDCSETIDKSSDQEDSSQTPCIEKVTYLRDDETAIVDLRQISLEIDSKYVIEFPRFTRPPFVVLDPSKPDEILAHWVWSCTIRKARKIFPCFDHPMFKVQFEYCIERNPSMMSISNMPLLIDQSRSKTTAGNLKIDCHQTTPRISTASFGLALLHDKGFDLEFRRVPNSDVLVEIFYRKGTADQALRVLDMFVSNLIYAEKLTRFKYPLPKLSVILLEDVPLIGYENFGLITLDIIDVPESHLESMIFMKIMHQWLGNLVSVRDLREICIQEGFVFYLEWRFSARKGGGSMKRAVAYHIEYHTTKVYMSEDYEPMGRLMLDDIADAQFRCQIRSSLFFHTLSEFYGGDDTDESGIVIELLRALMAKHANGSASIEDWDLILEEITKEKDHPIEGYFQGWFNQPGMLYLIVSKASTDCIRVRQKIVGTYASAISKVPRPIPIRVQVMSSTSNATKPIFLTELDQRICGTKGQRLLIDPDRHSWTRKVYPIGDYLFLLRQMGKDRAFLDSDHYSHLIHDFCRGLAHDLFPLDDDRNGTVAAWKEVANVVAQSATRGGNEIMLCHCCTSFLVAGDDNVAEDVCDGKIMNDCRRLRITQIVREFDDHHGRDEL